MLGKSFIILVASLLAINFASAQATCDSQSFQGVCILHVNPEKSEGPVADAAAKYVGKLRYVWGGISLENGVDCSGFVQQLFKTYGGVRLPRKASEQFKKGASVERNGLLPGDLVFFKNTGGREGITHVGIFTGEGPYGSCTFINAPGRNKLVQYANLCDGYHSQNYAGARRVSESQLAA